MFARQVIATHHLSLKSSSKEFATMAAAGDGSSPSTAEVESFVWRESNSGNSDDTPCWKIRYQKSSKIYDSDPHSLKIPRSHNAWKKELMMTRFANQELPEALWGENFLELTYGNRGSNNEGESRCGLRISFCAMEALRTWALMDMQVGRRKSDDQKVKSDRNDKIDANKMDRPHNDSKLPTIIPHKSGRIPDSWDYTYTTNYSGSVEYIGKSDTSSISNGFFRAKQPDKSTFYAFKVSSLDESNVKSSQLSKETTGTTDTNELDSQQQLHREPSPINPVELRAPMCKCVGGRMICAGIAQNLTTTTPSLEKAGKVRISKLKSSKPLSSSAKNQTSKSRSHHTQMPRARPKWIPYCRDTDGPFNMESLLNSQTSAPLHYTGTIPFWIQNLDPQSYSFFTVTAVVCDGGNEETKGGFIAVLLRCFVRVNGVRVRLIDTKFVVRRQKSSETIEDGVGSQHLSPMVVLRERSWQEGSWEEYTVGLSGGTTDGDYHFLGTDLEQGRRASKTLPHRFPPIKDKLVLHDSDFVESEEKEMGNCENTILNEIIQSDIVGNLETREVWEKSIPKQRSISHCAAGSRILVSVEDEHKLVALDIFTGKLLWEHNLSPSSVLSLTVQDFSLASPDIANVVVGDDRGCVHIINYNKNGGKDGSDEKNSRISIHSYRFDGSNEESERKKNVQRPSNWVEMVAWSLSGSYFAAAAGKKLMVNGTVLEMEGAVYSLAFLPSSQRSKDHKTQQNSNSTKELLAVALYGGVTIVNTHTMTILHHRFTVGSSAVLSFGVSPDGRSIAIGCLDKRLRILSRSMAMISNVDCKQEENDDHSPAFLETWDAHDWVGFDCGVNDVSFAPNNQRLAVLGRSIVLIINLKSKWGEAPTICSLSQDVVEDRMSGRDAKFLSIAWSTNDVLVASTHNFLYVFDVRATIDSVPKRSYPAISISLEKGFLAVGTDGDICVWGNSGIRKIKILNALAGRGIDEDTHNAVFVDDDHFKNEIFVAN